MKDKIEKYHILKRFFNTHKLRTKEDFTKGSVFMDVYDFEDYLMTLQFTDTQIGISPKGGDDNPFTGHDFVFNTEKEAKDFVKKHLFLNKVKVAESKSEIQLPKNSSTDNLKHSQKSKITV